MWSGQLESELGSRGEAPQARGSAEFHDAGFCRGLKGTAL